MIIKYIKLYFEERFFFKLNNLNKKSLYLHINFSINLNQLIMKKLFTFLATLLAVVALNAQNATIILEAHDVWGDGTGYQILLDPDATEYANVSGNFACGASYAAWEYLIPTNATAADDYVVVDGSISLEIPAGTYDYVVLNPGCVSYGVVYVASDQCDASLADNYVFEAGMTYHFVATLISPNDCITLTTSPTNIIETVGDKVNIYPNPANNVLHVTANGFNKMEIINFLGQVILSENVANSNFEVNVSDFNSGVYFVRFQGDNGTITKKFVKK